MPALGNSYKLPSWIEELPLTGPALQQLVTEAGEEAIRRLSEETWVKYPGEPYKSDWGNVSKKRPKFGTVIDAGTGDEDVR